MKINKFLQFKSIVITTLLLLLITQSFISVVTFAASDSIRNSPLIRLDEKSKNQKNRGNYIIKFKDDVSEEAKSEYLIKNGLHKDSIKNGEIKFNRALSSGIMDKLDLNVVEFIEEDGIIEGQSVEYNDPEYANQWYLEAVNFEQSEITTGEEKVVAVIDSGACASHPDLQGKILEGWNFVDDNSDTNDTNGHGCAVSGVIASSSNNSIGIVGIASNVKILPLKVIGNDGVGSYSDLMSAIDYAVSKKVDIINISLGGYFDSQILHEAIQNATTVGIKVVASAGNTGNSEIMYPAKFDEVISVGSVENDYTVSDFSTNSTDIDLWTYGSHILTTNKDNSYSNMQGTSISAGIVSGFLASGGQYKDGSIINYVTNEKSPIFFKNAIHHVEPITSLSIDIPASLTTYSFSNPDANSETFISWERNIQVSTNEQLLVTIWNRKDSKEIKEIFKTLRLRDNCQTSSNFCLVNFPNLNGDYAVFNKYIKLNNSLIRIRYNINNLVGFNVFKEILRTISIKNKEIDTDETIDFLEKSLVFPSTIHPQIDSCGGITDVGNPFICCTADTDHNNANCTWYAAYKRHDLWGIVTGAAGSWYQEAYDHDHNLVSSTPAPGAIVAWSGHVAYIESVNNSTSEMTWSEQNCYTYWIDDNGNRQYGVNGYNSSVTRATNSTYGGTLQGFIQPAGGNCNGTNPAISNWNSNGPQTCNPTSSLTIQPESHLTGNNGTITITVH